MAAALTEAGLIDHGLIDADAVRAVIDAASAGPGDPAPAYDRRAFGPSWSDTDHDGCDQREDVLFRDLDAVAVLPGTRRCVVTSGNLSDPYTGTYVDFVRGPGTSDAVGIDRVVSLPWAWGHGAATWDADRREEFASDLENLQAVDGPTMQDKRERGPAAWLPPAEDYRCVYAARFAHVVAAHGLSLDDGDRDALRAVLRTCPAPAKDVHGLEDAR
ncbi:HNH endonuclease family protein [Clavibacter sp. VKM Ac-2872]|uniref:HNH endonuclease family protein n=1 Tax=Clavibacter sp. VKM Ac-2872 TaxID=2783812 RepID=UPI00188C45EA|nr:HNH endonuclease family protein [Clavibacter sp. VKM Ac-2872]MBF4625813.1 HNH endonuclease [Clavibacter sp. VKM Ac-2872]